jgi:hypothetical protein
MLIFSHIRRHCCSLDPDGISKRRLVGDNSVSDAGTRGVVVVHWVGSNGKRNPIDLRYAGL